MCESYALRRVRAASSSARRSDPRKAALSGSELAQTETSIFLRSDKLTNLITLLRCVDLGTCIQSEKNVRVRHSAFLLLDGMRMTGHLSEVLFNDDPIDELVQLANEDSGHDI